MAPKILLFGSGSIGTVYIYVLSRDIGEQNVTAVCRSNYDVAVKNGFTLNSGLWGNNLKVQPKVVRSVDEAAASGEVFDYVVICSKAIPTKPSTAEIIRPAISEKTAIVLIQNGIAIEKEYSDMYPNNPLLSTVVYLPATQIAPGVVEHQELERLHIGTYPSDAPQWHRDVAKSFTDLINTSGATGVFHDDVQPERWSKLIVNASWNPIGALTRCRDVQFLKSNNGAADLVKAVMTEVSKVAQACGYNEINQDKVDWQIGRAVVRSLPGIQASMMADALSGKSMEVEAIVGNTIKIAKEKGVETPNLQVIYLLATALNDSFSRS